MTFYDKFEALCSQKNVTPTRVAREIGLTQQTVSHWKTRGSTPKAVTVQKIADYFEVPVSDLLGDVAGKAQYIKIGSSLSEGFYLFDLGFLNFKLRSVDCTLLKDMSGIRFPDGDLMLPEAELWELDGKTDSYIRSKLNELREKHKDNFTPKLNIVSKPPPSTSPGTTPTPAAPPAKSPEEGG